MKETSIEDQFFKKLLVTDSCILWNGATNSDGYGCIAATKQHGPISAHRFSYQYFNGTIPPGTELDHLCRILKCVNPEHLEAVPHIVNVRRGNAVKPWPTCRNGHPWYPDTTYTYPPNASHPHGMRRCMICRKANERNKRERRRQTDA